jgi:hypothetical protein
VMADYYEQTHGGRGEGAVLFLPCHREIVWSCPAGFPSPPSQSKILDIAAEHAMKNE